MHGRLTLASLVSKNGFPEHGLVTGLLIKRHTAAEATVAVVAAGATPYFSRRVSLDMLGKSDHRIARLGGRSGEAIGHNKYDIEYTLGKKPDLVVPLCAAASCREDDGRPVEVGCQEPASNHPKRLS